ncbi:MAG: YbbR-like domain-containing protein [Proteobacteria bacterium]|nr:YbbR-like domain-containing protein [Pseudomonadota bacterium]
MKFGKWIVNNFWLKAMALLFAVTTWFYVFNEIERTNHAKSSQAKMLPSYGKIFSRKLHVKAILIGEPAEGYRLNMDEVKIDPEYFIVAAPETVLNKVDTLETEPIDISRFKKTTVYVARLEPITPSLQTESLTVRVTIPVVKIEVKE